MTTNAGHASLVVNALPHPVLIVDQEGRIVDANVASEAFFRTGLAQLHNSRLADHLPFGSPVLSAVDDARRRKAQINEYRIDVGTPRIGAERIVDLNALPLTPSAEFIVIMMQERTIADKMDRQLTHRGAAR
ncbi:MAG TPA: PAS domain-containing protein, partial [Beijerinckiaceae bacterium]